MQPQHDQNDITYFAETNFRGEQRKFGIKTDDRRRHTYVIGKTGMGKSTMLENMIIQDIQNGKGLAVVDPHGDLVEKVINFIPSHRINDVVYLNPSDLNHPIAFNILEQVGPEYKNLVSNGLVGVFKKIWADSWGPRLEYILSNAILALLEYPGATLLGVTRMLVDGGYRKKVVRNITDPVVKQFWVEEFNNYSEKFRTEAIAPIQNKVGQFLSSSLIRNIVGQPKSTIEMRDIMDSGKILLMNLSKGRIGEENAALLGAMMITKIQLAAMSRVDIPEEERKDFYLYVDEFQNFSTESFAGILSEARKYRLDLIMAHQYIEQLSDEVKAAVFGNVGTLVSFRVGAIDGEELEKEFAPVFTQEDIVTLPAYHVYLRLMIDGVASEPFSATTLPPLKGETSNAQKVIDVSRERYANTREEVEENIRNWAGHLQGQDSSQNSGGGDRPGSNDRRGGGGDRRDGRDSRGKGGGRNDRRNDSKDRGGRKGSDDRNKRDRGREKKHDEAPRAQRADSDKNRERAPQQQEKRDVQATIEPHIVPAPPATKQSQPAPAPTPSPSPHIATPAPAPTAPKQTTGGAQRSGPQKQTKPTDELTDLREKNLSFVQRTEAVERAPQQPTEQKEVQQKSAPKQPQKPQQNTQQRNQGQAQPSAGQQQNGTAGKKRRRKRRSRSQSAKKDGNQQQGNAPRQQRAPQDAPATKKQQERKKPTPASSQAKQTRKGEKSAKQGSQRKPKKPQPLQPGQSVKLD